MKYSEYKSIKGVAIAGLALTAILLGTMVYQDVQKYYHGSFSEAYNSFQEDFKRFPFSTLH